MAAAAEAREAVAATAEAAPVASPKAPADAAVAQEAGSTNLAAKVMAGVALAVGLAYGAKKTWDLKIKPWRDARREAR